MAANGLGRHGLMDAIDQALDSGDTSHLVRLVFATDPSRFLPAPSGPDTDTVTTSLGDDDGFPGGNVLESVLEALQEVSEDREMEIQDICRCSLARRWTQECPGVCPETSLPGPYSRCSWSCLKTLPSSQHSRHGMEIATALAQLGPLQGDLKDLKRAVQANNSQYQALGSQYLTLHDSLLSWQGTMARLASLQSLTDRLVAGWSLCLHAVQAEAGGKLYRAYCLLGEVPTGSATAAESALSSQAAALRQGIVTAVQSSINSWLVRMRCSFCWIYCHVFLVAGSQTTWHRGSQCCSAQCYIQGARMVIAALSCPDRPRRGAWLLGSVLRPYTTQVPGIHMHWRS